MTALIRHPVNGKMQVRYGRKAGIAGKADFVTSRDGISQRDSYTVFLQVIIFTYRIISMQNGNKIGFICK